MRINKKGENTQAVFNILGPICLNGINFVTTPIFTRVLGTEGYGIMSVFSTWVSVLSVVLCIKADAAVGQAQIAYGEKGYKKYNSSTLFLAILSALVWLILLAVFKKIVARFLGLNEIFVWLLWMQAFGTAIVSFATATFTFGKEAHKTFLTSVAVTLVTTVLSLILVYHSPNHGSRYMGKIVGTAIPYFLFGVGLSILLLARGKKFFDQKYWKFCFLICVPTIFHSLSHLVLSQSDRVMLQKMLPDGDSQTGIYSFVFMLVHVVNIIWVALNNTWVPFYYDDMKNKEHEKIRRKAKNYRNTFTIITVGFLLLVPEVLKLFAPREYWGGMKLVPLMVGSVYLIFIYTFPVNYEFFFCDTKRVAIGTCLSAGLNLLLNWYAIPRLGMMGAAIATLVSYLFLVVFHQWIATHMQTPHPFEFSFRFYLPGLAGVTTGTVLFYVFQKQWYIRWPLGLILGLWCLQEIKKRKNIF